MADPFVGEIRMVGFNYAPRGWALCNGATVPINQYVALYSLIGITFGGNGTTNFALPNFQGNTPMGAGSGPGLSPRSPGQTGGTTAVTLQQSQIPGHTHAMMCAPARSASTLNAVAGDAFTNASSNVYAPAGNQTPMSGSVLPAVGGGGAHNNMMPYLTVNFIIALQGIFPPRP